jgi:hypothetical protein
VLVLRYPLITDAQLLSQCRFEAFRGPGPGGQKRNKTSSAVRLTHMPTGIFAIAGESRSQHRNREMALMRLRHRMALEIREPFDAAEPLPHWLALRGEKQRLNLTQKSDLYLPALGLTLDILATLGFSVSETARALGVTTAHLVSFLRQDEKLWAHVNQHRISAGLRPLVGQK